MDPHLVYKLRKGKQLNSRPNIFDGFSLNLLQHNPWVEDIVDKIKGHLININTNKKIVKF